ncbi:MAG: MBL fold metallo-hydrolase [Hyphomicrobium sp.]|uniref:MBL fold metallo-hydrolase n=1 Tax=Hyphomicrobium sp. TaxID=82 RepID=UPI00132B388F|nr:MBL fold metallo-hydrolase [Hyphomicrobium sp.]KAB2939282.1 MAG: MBL fold metallo-hydrolase [Hyphomicrobium sp.]MBZ0208152.1 MBL fold metallo-hydrolase [Hyphomicrobium sp.]
MTKSEKSSPASKGLKAAIVPVTPFQQNCTLLWDAATMKGAVVDPGGDLDRIEAAIAEVGMQPAKILLTHGHIDHAGGAAELRERLGGIPIEGPHANERPLLDALEQQGQAYGMEARAVTPDRWLADGDTVSVAGHTFEVLHCPGHSPGSVVLFNRAQRFALMGDVLFQGSIGRTDLPLGSHESLMHAIRTKVLPLGDDVAFICGHGPTSTIGQERRTNPFIIGDAA